MNPRLYRLIEAHQRIDFTLHRELRRPRPDNLRVMRLRRLKQRAKALIHRLARPAALGRS